MQTYNLYFKNVITRDYNISLKIIAAIRYINCLFRCFQLIEKKLQLICFLVVSLNRLIFIIF